jgi:spore coat protein CotF
MAQSATAGTALGRLTDQVIAADLAIYAGAAVKAYAAAIAEATTPAFRLLLKKQFDQAITFQEQIGFFTAERGFSIVGDLDEVLKKDAEQTKNTLNLLR